MGLGMSVKYEYMFKHSIFITQISQHEDSAKKGFRKWARVLGFDIIKEKSMENKLESKISFLKALIFFLYSFFSLLSLNILTKVHFSTNSSFSLI